MLSDLVSRLGIIVSFPTLIIVLSILRFLVRRIPIPKVIFYSLSLGQVFRRGNSEDFAQFIAEKRFGFGFASSEILVELKGFRKRKSTSVTITRNVAVFLILHCLTWNEFLKYASFSLKFSFQALVHKSIHSQPSKKLIQMQIEFPLWKSSGRLEQTICVTTQSTMLNLPICFYVGAVRLEKLMLWYSANNRPTLRIGEPEPPYPNALELKNYIDTHLVWSENERLWLRSQGIDNVKVLGSMTFTPRQRNLSDDKFLDVVYFDVTAIPRNDIFMSEEMLTENLMGYVGALESLRELKSSPVKGYLKPKREHTKIHSKDYINLRNNLADSDKFDLLDFDIDLYEVIAKSRLVLAVPYTSPAFIAQELNIPVAFFCLSPRDYQLELEMNCIPVLKNRDDLKQFILNAISR